VRHSPRAAWLVGIASLLLVAAGNGSPTPCGQFSEESSPTRGYSQVFNATSAVPGTNTVWAVGSFHDNSLAADQTLTEFWDGTVWTQVRSPSLGQAHHDNNALRSVDALAADDVWAIGYHESTSGNDTLTMHWDGSRWTVVASPNAHTYDELLSVAAVSSTDVWSVGHFLNTAHDPVRQETLAQHWDGTAWSTVATPNVTGRDDNELVSVAAIPGTNQAIAVGYHQWEAPRALVEVWDGAGWSVLPTPKVSRGGEYLNAVTALGANDIWAVGFSIDRYGTFHGLTMHWDGAAWTVVPPQAPGGDGYDPMLKGVTALAADDVWLVGTYYNGNSALLTLAEHWNGSRWRRVPSVNPGGESAFAANVFNGVAAVGSTDIRAVGYWHAPGFDADHALIEAGCP
jgi:hypothetical protein